jgi:MinD superfamily P-loop ATPase
MIARHQHEHEAINAREYPGTRQLCAVCDEPTERCEEDAIYTEEGEGPLCVECWHKTPEYILENVKVSHPDSKPVVEVKENNL